MTIRENNKKLMKNEYFIEISCKIDKLMWVFCKSDGVKQKKQVFCIKQTESFRRANAVALRWTRLLLKYMYSVYIEKPQKCSLN